MLKRFKNGSIWAMFLGPKDETRPKKIWVPKSLIPPMPTPNAKWSPKPKVAPIYKWVPKSQN